jgi:2-haloacid dehalogenase
MILSDYKVLSFDCYGTLIDWEAGIQAALAPLMVRAGRQPDAALEDYAVEESAQEAETPNLRYAELLARVHARLARAWGVASTAAADDAFGRSVPDWPAFPDSPAALAYLKRHYRLVILSNVDRQSFAGSNRRLGVEFDAILTAEDIGSYKPDPRNFRYLLDHVAAMGHAPAQLLHVAQSLYHDHVPANAAGIASCWIDRRAGKAGGGATKTPATMPRFAHRFESLAALAQAVAAEKGETFAP